MKTIREQVNEEINVFIRNYSGRFEFLKSVRRNALLPEQKRRKAANLENEMYRRMPTLIEEKPYQYVKKTV